MGVIVSHLSPLTDVSSLLRPYKIFLESLSVIILRLLILQILKLFLDVLIVNSELILCTNLFLLQLVSFIGRFP